MADIPDDLNKKVTRMLHDEGTEMTPDEVRAEGASGLAKVRQYMREHGYPVPEGDLELLTLMRMCGL